MRLWKNDYKISFDLKIFTGMRKFCKILVQWWYNSGKKQTKIEILIQNICTNDSQIWSNRSLFVGFRPLIISGRRTGIRHITTFLPVISRSKYRRSKYFLRKIKSGNAIDWKPPDTTAKILEAIAYF